MKANISCTGNVRGKLHGGCAWKTNIPCQHYCTINLRIKNRLARKIPEYQSYHGTWRGCSCSRQWRLLLTYCISQSLIVHSLQYNRTEQIYNVCKSERYILPFYYCAMSMVLLAWLNHCQSLIIFFRIQGRATLEKIPWHQGAWPLGPQRSFSCLQRQRFHGRLNSVHRYHRHPPALFCIIQPKSWYPFYHSTKHRKLSCPRHCSNGVQPMLETACWVLSRLCIHCLQGLRLTNTQLGMWSGSRDPGTRKNYPNPGFKLPERYPKIFKGQ